MKGIALLLLSVLAIISLHAQNDKEIILSNKVNLKYELGDEYKRDSLTLSEIKIADSLVAKYVWENHSKYSWSRRIENYFEYYRQYAGYKIMIPEKIIFINAFFIKPQYATTQYLQENLILFMGGGSGFFTIKVNLQTHTCFDLSVNAPK